ncbi:MAG: GGDEF domain-containing protein [Psychromonas sp.]|jgi:GGDEF domain-containing protein
MKDTLRDGNTLSRFRGDECVGVLTDLEKKSNCEFILKRLLKSASNPLTVSDTVVKDQAISIDISEWVINEH